MYDDSLLYRQRNDLLSLAVECQCEFTIIEILKAAYRTSKSGFKTFLSTLESLFSKVIDENKRFILVGDLNMDYLTTNP